MTEGQFDRHLNNQPGKFETLSFSALMAAAQNTSLNSFPSQLNQAFNRRARQDLLSLNTDQRAKLIEDLLSDCLAGCVSAHDLQCAEIYLQRLKSFANTNLQPSSGISSPRLQNQAQFVLSTILKDKDLPLINGLVSCLLPHCPPEMFSARDFQVSLKGKVRAELKKLKPTLMELERDIFCPKSLPREESAIFARQTDLDRRFAEVQKKLHSLLDFCGLAPIEDILEKGSKPGNFLDQKTNKDLFRVCDLHLICSCEFVSLDPWTPEFVLSYERFFTDFRILPKARANFLLDHLTSYNGITHLAFKQHNFSLVTHLLSLFPREHDLSQIRSNARVRLNAREKDFSRCLKDWAKSKLHQTRPPEQFLLPEEAKAVSMATNHFIRAESFHLDEVVDSFFELAKESAEKDHSPIESVYLLTHLLPEKSLKKHLPGLFAALEPELREHTRRLNTQINSIKEYGFEYLSCDEYARLRLSHRAVLFFLKGMNAPEKGIKLKRLPREFDDHEILQRFIEENEGGGKPIPVHLSRTDWDLEYQHLSSEQMISESGELSKPGISAREELFRNVMEVQSPGKIAPQYNSLIRERGTLLLDVFKDRQRAHQNFILAFDIAYTSESPVSANTLQAVRSLRLFYEQTGSPYSLLFRRLERRIRKFREDASKNNSDAIFKLYNSQEFSAWQNAFHQLPSADQVMQRAS